MSESVLIGISVGPGDPELITLKSLRWLQRAEVVCLPVSRPGQPSLAGRIAAPHLQPTQQVLELVYPTDGRSAHELEARWTANAKVIASSLFQAHYAAFLTEGDPMLYSTFVHTLAALRSEHPEIKVEIVPGVSAVTAAAAASQTPLAVGDDGLAILPASAPREQLRTALQSYDTVVLLKLSAGLDRALDLLEEAGRIDQAVWVRRCGQPEQEILADVHQLRGKAVDYFSLLIVSRSRR